MFIFLRIILVLLTLVSIAKADTAIDQSSANYNKAKDFIPGEEVITPTGKTVKVWSTKGPVEVSKAPEPFADDKKAKFNGDTHILVNEETFKPKPTPEADK